MTRTEARRFGKHRRIVTMIIAAIAVIGLAAMCVAVRPWTLAGHVTATGRLADRSRWMCPRCARRR